MIRSKLRSILVVPCLLLLAGTGSVMAQQSGAEISAPVGMPPEIAGMLNQGGGEVAVAPPSRPADQAPPPGAGLAGTRYLFTTLRVVNNGNPRGCSYSNWDCMTNLCKSDLQDNSAWRGWAGCWRDGNNYICYFECGQTRNAF